MATYSAGDGVRPGEYFVTIEARVMSRDEKSFGASYSLIPTRYNDPKTSGFTATIPSGAKETIELNFPLVDDPKEAKTGTGTK